MSRRQRNRRTRHHAVPAAVLYACEALEPRTLLNTVLIKGDAGTLSITLSSHTVFHLGIHNFVDWSINDVNNGQTQSAALGPTDTVMVDTGPAEVGVNVLSTAAPTTIQGDSPSDDILNLGGSNGLQGIAWPITITDTAGFWDITADDSKGTTSRTGILADGILSSLAPADIVWDSSKCHGLAIDTSSHGGTMLNVLQTNVPTMIRGHSSGADDSLTIGNTSDGLADITAALSIGNETPLPSGLINLTLDDQAEPVGATRISYLLENGQLSDGPLDSETPLPVTWKPGALRSLTIKTQAASHANAGQLRVESTNVPTTVISDANILVVQVGDKTHSTDGILGNLYLTNLGGSTELEVYDLAGHAAGPVVTLHTISVPGDSAPYGAIDGMAPGTIAYRYADTASMALFGAGGDNVNVLATGSNVNMTTVSGVAKVAVGDGGTLQNIAGFLDIDNGSATIDDSADPNPRNASVFFSAPTMSSGGSGVIVQGLSPAAITNGNLGGTTDSLTINGGTAANAYVVDGPHPAANFPANIGLTLNTGGGNDTVQVLAAAFVMPLTINGQGGNDAFTINYSDSFSGNLILNGGTGSDTLTIVGPAINAPFSLTHDTITFSSPTQFGSITTKTTYTAFKTLALGTGNFEIADDMGGLNLSTFTFANVRITMSTHFGALSVGDTTQITLAPSLMPLSKTLFCSGLPIAGSGKLDLTNNALQLSYAAGADPIATIRSYLASGFNNGTWNGNGIITSAGDATHALGFGGSADGIVSGLSPGTILVRWTRFGDVNLDGAVGFPDLIAVARNYGKSGLNWDQGNMTYGGGAVGFNDLLLVARNYGASAAVRGASAMFAAAPLGMPIKTRRRR